MTSIAEPKAGGRQVVADHFQGKIDTMEGAPPIFLQADGDGLRGADFPARLIPKDSRDAYILDKEAAYKFEKERAAASGGQVMRTVGPEDVDYLRRKRSVMNRLAFDKWMTDAINMSDPVAGKKSTKKGGKGVGKKVKGAKSLKPKPTPKTFRRHIIKKPIRR